VFCPKCGAKNDDTATFCASCGASLRASEGPGSPGPAASPAPSGGLSVASIRATLQDAIDLVKSPGAFMTARQGAIPPVSSTLVNYVAVLALIPLIFTFLGDLIFRRGHGLVYALGAGIVAYIFGVVSVLVVGYVLWWLAPRFASVADLNKAVRMVAWVYTPVLLIAVVNIVPDLDLLNLLALLYGLYILYIGLPIVLKTPKDRVVTYVIVTLVVTFVVYFILTLIALGLR
jgi:hypothetical protein